MTFNIYALPGRLYDGLYLGLTLGAEQQRVKVPGLRQLGLTSGQTVVDWGCGTGLLLPAVAGELGAGVIIGVDRSLALLARAKSRAPRRPGVTTWFVAGDGTRGLSVSKRVDAVIASYSLGVGAPDQYERLLDDIHGALARGGKVLIIDMYRPAAKKSLERAYYAAHAFFATLLFRQDFSGRLLDCARQRFDEVSYVECPSLLAFSWIGRKR